MMFLVSLMLGIACVGGTDEFMNDGSCTYEGKHYNNNEVIDSNPCRPLECINGHVPILIIDCVNAACVDYEVRPGDCCASCPTGPNCRLPDGTLMPGDESRTLEDGRHCVCLRSYSFGIIPVHPDAMCTYPPTPPPNE